MTSIAFFYLVACAAKSPQTPETPAPLPEWVNSHPENCAVGSSLFAGNMTLTMELSKADARKNFANKIDLQCESSQEDLVKKKRCETDVEIGQSFTKESTLIDDKLYSLICFK